MSEADWSAELQRPRCRTDCLFCWRCLDNFTSRKGTTTKVGPVHQYALARAWLSTGKGLSMAKCCQLIAPEALPEAFWQVAEIEQPGGEYSAHLVCCLQQTARVYGVCWLLYELVNEDFVRGASGTGDEPRFHTRTHCTHVRHSMQACLTPHFLYRGRTAQRVLGYASVCVSDGSTMKNRSRQPLWLPRFSWGLTLLDRSVE